MIYMLNNINKNRAEGNEVAQIGSKMSPMQTKKRQ
jgi:hypothetical protein